MKQIFDFHWISESRSFLMGWAILNVMVLHGCSWAHITLDKLVLHLFSVVFTGTFLFLSGYSIYFSLHKNSEAIQFFKKRVSRLLIPYLLMVTPFYLFFLIEGEIGMLDFLLRETTIYNILVSNNGMWYITASIMMYCLSPYIYRMMEPTASKALTAGCLVTLFFVFLSLSIHTLAPEYSLHTSILWDKLAIFIVGMLFADITLNHRGWGG